MNTGKQVNVMIGLLFLLLLVLGGYFLNEGNRQQQALEDITERNAERGARLFVQNCRGCHGLTGLGPEDDPPGFGAKLNSSAFLILREGNEFGLDPTAAGEATGIRKFLFDTISCGRTGTFMPVWSQRFGGPLSELQIDNIVVMITNVRWDLVAIESVEADEVAGLTEEEVRASVVSDPSALSVTQSNCGQYSGADAQSFRARDPFSAEPPSATATAPPAATTATAPPAAGGEVVEISLTEFGLAVTAGSAEADGVTFRVSNDGAIAHELVIVRSDLAVDALPQAGGAADESQLEVVGRIDQWPGGESREATFSLAAGQYILICNLPGHYQLGMRAAFTVQ